MATRKTLVGLSLLCALVFCAFGAASASAAGGTTAFTCVENGGKTDFSDAHCDTRVAEGKYGHVEIPAGTPTEFVATNNKTGAEITSWTLNLVIAATAIEITCEGVHGTGSLQNNAGTAMSVTGQGQLTFTNCKLLKPESQKENCTVTIAPMGVNFATVENKMEVKFSPSGGAALTEITLANAPGKTCKGVAGTFKMEGTFAATGIGGEAAEPKHSGATWKFTKAMTAATLIFAGNKAELEGSLTFRMGPNPGEGNPIVLTTE